MMDDGGGVGREADSHVRRAGKAKDCHLVQDQQVASDFPSVLLARIHDREHVPNRPLAALSGEVADDSGDVIRRNQRPSDAGIQSC